MRAYHRLTEGERNQVYALKKAGLTQRAIADHIGVHKSTICRELQRNTGLRGQPRHDFRPALSFPTVRLAPTCCDVRFKPTSTTAVPSGFNTRLASAQLKRLSIPGN